MKTLHDFWTKGKGKGTPTCDSPTEDVSPQQAAPSRATKGARDVGAKPSRVVEAPRAGGKKEAAQGVGKKKATKKDEAATKRKKKKGDDADEEPLEESRSKKATLSVASKRSRKKKDDEDDDDNDDQGCVQLEEGSRSEEDSVEVSTLSQTQGGLWGALVGREFGSFRRRSSSFVREVMTRSLLDYCPGALYASQCRFPSDVVSLQLPWRMQGVWQRLTASMPARRRACWPLAARTARSASSPPSPFLRICAFRLLTGTACASRSSLCRCPS